MRLYLPLQEAGDIPKPSPVNMFNRKVSWRNWHHILSSDSSYPTTPDAIYSSMIKNASLLHLKIWGLLSQNYISFTWIYTCELAMMVLFIWKYIGTCWWTWVLHTLYQLMGSNGVTEVISCDAVYFSNFHHLTDVFSSLCVIQGIVIQCLSWGRSWYYLPLNIWWKDEQFKGSA